MSELLRKLYGSWIDWPELITGLILGAVLVFAIQKIGVNFSDVFEYIYSVIQSISGAISGKSGDPYKLDLLERMEMLHASKALFKVSEIAVPPHLLAPPIPADPVRTDPIPEYTLAVLPNLPDWNYLSGIYHAPSISIANALSEGANFMITGELGSGKTFALAHFAILALNKSPDAGIAAEMTPIFVHAADLEFRRRSEKDPLNVLIPAVQKTVSSNLASSIPNYLRPLFRKGKALLLLDGLDECTVEEITPITEWLGDLQMAFPNVRIIASGPARNYDGIVHAGLAPVAIAPWTEHDRSMFLAKWGQAWQQHIRPLLPKKRMYDVDPSLISGWFSNLARGLTPLEMTLRVWSAYMGDAKDTTTTKNIDAYLARLLSPNERPQAEAIGLNWLNERRGIVSERSIGRGTSTKDFISAGILIRRANNHISFTVPAIGAYLGARAMLSQGLAQQVFEPGWTPAETSLGFYAALGGDLAQVVGQYLGAGDDPLNSNLFITARWLRAAPAKAPWRANILRSLATLANSSDKPYGLRLRAVHALTRSEDPSTAILFRRLLASEDRISRILGALGLGGVQDEESIERLLDTVDQDRELHVRQAACLALAAIGTNPALEGIGKILLDGEEAVRLAVAEALAAQPGESINMLRDAIEVENILTRRAAVFGLARIPEDWIPELLQTMHLEDDQWIVRGAAAEALERIQNPPWKVYSLKTELSTTPWLVEFAKREGLAIAPGKASLELLRQALNKGKDEEKVAALEAIGNTAAEEMSLELQQALKSNQQFLKDSAFEALWRINASGLHQISYAQSKA
ncbi:MAG: HEAT repeat domain-containing protein [Anaerolineales bacterium]|jgi:HEAT repeat protein